MKSTKKKISNFAQFEIEKELKSLDKIVGGSHPLNGADFWPLT